MLDPLIAATPENNENSDPLLFRSDFFNEVRIVDYVDAKVPMLARMFEKRRVGYRAMGYQDDGIRSLNISE